MTKNKKHDKNLPQNQHKPNNNDSKTSDVSRVLVHDSRLTVRVNSKLKEAILRHCKAKGLSVCHLFETLFIGYLRGFYDKIDLDVKSPTINLTVVRDVKRVRRYAREVVDDEESEKFPCPRFGVFVERDKLPLQSCLKCPNRACREYVLSLASKGFGELDE